MRRQDAIGRGLEVIAMAALFALVSFLGGMLTVVGIDLFWWLRR